MRYLARTILLGWIALVGCATATTGGSDGGATDARQGDAIGDASGDGAVDALTCPMGQTACSRLCVDTRTSTAHCGACGNGCATGQTCAVGACVSSSTCPTGQTNCGGACVNPQTDPANCGVCGTACATGQACVSGMCRAALACVSGETDCGGACVNTATDAANCGACARVCAAGETCMAGSCAPTSCASGQTRCGTACVDLATDRANCGACGTACAVGQSCMGSVCASACVAPMTTCTSGTMTLCVDLQTDSSNCGTCGTACPTGRSCVAGACACAPGYSLCAGTCVNTATDPGNCGTCGAACAAGQVCSGSACGCTAPLTLCGGTCTLTSVDTANCGTCGTVCSGGQSCASGTCATSSCAGGQTVCAGVCVDTQADSANCGGCGAACAPGLSCAAGVCRPVNDLRANALPIAFGSAEVQVAGTTVAATHDGPTVPCLCTNYENVWYTFTLTAREVVYFDTAGSGFDSSLSITDSLGGVLQGNAPIGSTADGYCNDDSGCGTTGAFVSTFESRTWAVLAAGTYYLAVGGCSAHTFTLRAQHLPTNVGSYFYASQLAGMGTTSTLLVGTSGSAGTCGGTSSGEDVRWFVTCGATEFFSLCQSDGGTFTRSNGTVSWDPSMYVRSANTGSEVVCNDDGGLMGGTNCAGTGGDTLQYGSRINNVATPRGLNAVFVDSRTGGSGMSYTLAYAVQ